MTEEFLQYVWKYSLFDEENLFTTEGKEIEIIHTGLYNSDAGPDFFNAQLRIDGTRWAGNIEVHIKSSYWLKHKHETNKAYNNVILHVVWENDKDLVLHDGLTFPVLELKSIISPEMINRYKELKKSSGRIPCESQLHKVDSLTLHSWLDRLVAERLERKTNLISANLDNSRNDWEETFYRLLLRTLGNPLNSAPFERLASVLPFKILSKHHADLLQTEAILLGQAGFLEGSFMDEYMVRLQQEYHYLRHKLNLTSISKAEWKFMRIRPPQFPTIRLAQLAAVINKKEYLFRAAVEAQSLDDIIKLFSVKPSEYWLNHFQPEKYSERKAGAMGKSTIAIIAINAVIPGMFIYGKNTGKEEIAENALELLRSLKPESNHIIKKWISVGIQPADAYESQALLQLRNEYCDKRRCVNCAIGHKVMNAR